MTLVFIYDNRSCSSRPQRDAVATRREAFLPPSSQARNQSKPFCRSLIAIFLDDAIQSAIRRSNSSQISRHTPREIIALTHSKQTTGGTISRHKMQTRLNAISSRNRLCPRTLSRTICYMIKFTPLACGVYRRHCVRRNHGSRALLRNDEWRGDA